MSTLYLKAEPETIAPHVLFSGDPFRVEVLKGYLENPHHVAFSREYNTYTGYYKGVKVTVTSTGIGAPGAAIAMEEMYEAGMETAVRMGTAMSLDASLLGQFLIPIAAMREEGVTKTYVEDSYPAVSDMTLVRHMNEAVVRLGGVYENGINCTMDGFYSQMHESRFSRETGRDIVAVFDRLRRLHVSGIDMESACILTLGRLMGVKSCIVTVVTVSEQGEIQLEEKERRQAEDLLCRVALEGIYHYHMEKIESEK